MAEGSENHNAALLSWKAPSFMPFHRGRVWHLVAGTLMGLLVTYALISGSITMTLALAALVVAFYLSHKQQPRMVEVSVRELGIEYDGALYPYHQIKSFWLLYHPPYVSVLYLKLGDKHPKLIKIELADQNPNKLRKLLLNEIPEDEGGNEPPFDLFARLMRL